MEKILISSCLMGIPVRYDGKSVPVESQILERWKSEGRLVAVCPEVLGGLPVPRPSVEIIGIGGGQAVWDGKTSVQRKDGFDDTQSFLLGAQSALEIAKKLNIK